MSDKPSKSKKCDTVRTGATGGGVAVELRRAIAKAQRQGVTMYRIAKLSGVSSGVLTRLMSGETVPTLATAERLAVAIGRRVVLQ